MVAKIFSHSRALCANPLGPNLPFLLGGWKKGAADSLTSIVKARFGFSCAKVKKKNVNVWVIAFGTELNPLLSDCAGPGHAFQADSGDELAGIFAKIARSISNLRITK